MPPDAPAFRPQTDGARWWRPLLDRAEEDAAIACRLGRTAATAFGELAAGYLANLDRAIHNTPVAECGAEAVFAEFPVLRRLVSTLLADWADFIGEFEGRLAVDRPFLDETFGGGGSLGGITTLSAGLSDRHQGGRQVLRITFANGKKLFYKPKNFTAEHALAAAIRLLRDGGLTQLPKLPKTLSRPSYGWVEFVENSPCVSRAEVEAYYRQAGMLIGLCYFLHGTDCTMDNLVATRSGPVLIDTEAFFQPAVHPFRPVSMRKSTAPADFSVLETGLLPFTHRSPDGKRSDISGLGGMPDNEAALPNRPILESEIQLPEGYMVSVLEGFHQLAQVIIQQRTALLDLLGSAEFIENLRTRLIFRDTATYGKFLRDVCRPQYLCSEEKWIEAFENLSRPFVKRGVPSASFWPLVEAECRALDRLDLPRFYVRVDSEDLQINGESIPAFFRGTAMDQVRRTIQECDESVVQWQSELIQASLSPNSVGLSGRFTSVDTSTPWLELALEIAEAIHSLALHQHDGIVRWPRPSFERRGPLPTLLQQVDLYEGGLGTTLFLAAAQKRAGTEAFREAIVGSARGAKQVLARLISDGGPIAHGAGSGLGSLVLGGLFITRLTGYPEFSELAALAAAEMTPERLAVADAVDAFRGLAGGLLALLAFHEGSADAAALARAAECGHRLLERCAPGAKWEGEGGDVMSGFAHGAAGIAIALARLYAATGDESFRAGAELAYGFLGGASADGHVHATPGQPECSGINGWCRGGPGLALARLGALNVLDRPGMRQEIATALRASAQESVRYDHLCCGRAGHIEALLTVGRALHDSDLTDLAEQQARALWQRAVGNGHYILQSYFAKNFCLQPGLFRGMAGLGYVFLRLSGAPMPFSLLSFTLDPS